MHRLEEMVTLPAICVYLCFESLCHNESFDCISQFDAKSM
jgi:hypothetical protein